MAKVKVDSALLDRAKKAAKKAGYSSVEELVAHAIEMALAKVESDQSGDSAAQQLRGLGYIE